jgi:hypothetical protein
MAGKGGAIAGNGRKPKADEEKANYIFTQTIKKIYGGTDDDEARMAFAADLLSFERGKMFVAEHLFGKPKDKVETTLNVNDFNIKDIVKFKD